MLELIFEKIKSTRLVFVDASFEPGGYCGIGGLVYSDTGCCTGSGAKCWTRWSPYCASALRVNVKPSFYELEALAAVLARRDTMLFLQ